MQKNIVEVKNVSKIFKGEKGIKKVSFNVVKGSFHAIIGSNGAGKTTFIKTLLGLYQEYSGSIKINDISIKNRDSYKSISYISERPIFPSEFSAEGFLIWAGRLAGKVIDEVRADIIHLTKVFGIEHLLKRNPNKFSSGEKQKIMLMKILIEGSNLIVMDEPTANLDPSARIIFFDQIKKMHDEGKSIIICTHNLEEIEEKVTNVTVFRLGHVVYNDKKGKKRLMDIFRENEFKKDGE